MTNVSIIIMVELENFHCVSLCFSRSRSEPNLGGIFVFPGERNLFFTPSEEVNDNSWKKILTF